MKSITRYSLLFCLAWACMFFASCADDIIQNDTTLTGKPFELKVSQSTEPATRLELGQDGLTTRWQPNDKLVLVDKARTKAPIYLTCTLTEPAASATFASESGVPAGAYWVIYNYNENLAYGHQGFSSVDEINRNNKLVLYGELNITEGTSSASVEMRHLYAQVRIQLKNISNGTNYIIGMYSSKKGFPVFKQFAANGLVNAEYGIDPNSMNRHTNTYFPSDKKWHNIRFGQYNARGTWIEGYYDDNNNYVDGYFQPSAQQLSNSALVLPENMSDEDVYFYVLRGNQCYEFKKTNKVNLKAGISYTVVLDFNDATVKTSTLNGTTDNNGMNTVYEISTPEQWRHAAYRNENDSRYKITDNIDFAGEHFFPINANTINGNGKTLRNITLDWSDEDNVGLYKREWRWETWNSSTQTSDNWHMEIEQPKSNYCTISNLTLESVTFKGKSYVGAFGGYNVSADKCKVIGTSVVSGTGDYVGGIVGWNSLSSYNYEDNKTPILSDVSVGQNCTVTGANYVGGIVGAYEQGENYSMQFSSSQQPLDVCISSATVTAKGNYVGGIFGKMGGYNANNASSSISFSMDDYTYTLLKCQNRGNVTGNDYVGGIGGDFALSFGGGNNTVDRVVLRQSFSDGKVKGNNYVGGILGCSLASVNTCYSINTVEATTTGLGGIVGTMNMSYMARIANCYSLSELVVGANGTAGGIVGLGGGGALGVTVTNSYFAGTNPTNCGIIGNSEGSCTVDHCLTTLSSLGTNLDTSATARPSNPRQEWNPDTQQSETVYDYYPDFIIESHHSVTSILANKAIINRDNAYSDNTWSGYLYDCVKFASFSADTNSPNFDDEVIN